MFEQLFLAPLDLALKQNKGTRWDSFVTWKPLEGAKNRQIHLDSLSLLLRYSCWGGRQHRRALTRTLPARITGPKRNTHTEDKPNTLSYCICEKKQTSRRGWLSPQQPGGCEVLLEARV